MKRDLSIYMKDMLTNMELAESFVADISYGEFVEDEKTYYAVIRCIEVIGEASKHITAPIRREYPQIPWKDIAGMRDKAIHFYFGMNPERVWLVVKEDIPQIKPIIKKILKQL